ncbi:MAG: hypothetical protein Kow0069_15770 [Promethearchaeota archaeon]
MDLELLGSTHLRYADVHDALEMFEMEERAFDEDGFSLELIRALIEHDAIVVLLEASGGGPILAFAIVTEDVRKRWLETRGGRAAHLVNFVVRPGYQDRGLGTHLLEVLMKGLSQEYSWMILEVKTDNQRAIHVYEKLGFRVVRRVPGYYQSGADCFVMVARL